MNPALKVLSRPSQVATPSELARFGTPYSLSATDIN